MLKNISRYLILAAIQLTVLAFAMFFLAPYFLASMDAFTDIAKTLEKTRLLSGLIRALLYVAVFYAWPYITKKFIQNPSDELLKQINKARFVLIGALLSIEILYWVGQI